MYIRIHICTYFALVAVSFKIVLYVNMCLYVCMHVQNTHIHMHARTDVIQKRRATRVCSAARTCIHAYIYTRTKHGTCAEYGLTSFSRMVMAAMAFSVARMCAADVCSKRTSTLRPPRLTVSTVGWPTLFSDRSRGTTFDLQSP